MAAAAVSLACPLRRSTRLAHAHAHRYTDPDDASDDPENELTPRALRALKRQRLALDPDGLPFSSRPRTKRRRRDSQRPSPPTPLTPSPADAHALPRPVGVPLDSSHSPLSTATPHASPTPIPDPITDPPPCENRPPSPLFRSESAHPDPSKLELSIPPPPPMSPSSADSEPLTPLTPLTPSPEPSPSLPGHDRHTLPLSPLQDPLPPPVPLDPIPIPHPVPNPQPSPPASFTPSPLDPALDTLIPFDGLPPQFDPELSVSIPSPPTPPQLQGLELQGQFHSFPQHQLYVPPNPVFVRDREINIWKLACQERVDCLLRRYGVDYIKALVESQARSVPSSSPSQTKFRLYTPASYTYSLSSWGSTSGTRKAFPVDDQGDDADPSWSTDDADWVDADVDMEDEDDDDYEDDDDVGEGEAERDGEATLEAVEGLVITDTCAPKQDSTAPMDVDGPSLDRRPSIKADTPSLPRSATDPSPRPLAPPVPHVFPPPPPLTPPTLPLLSSLHVPLLSEPPRAFMGRGTPPDRRRLSEWSSSGRFATNGMGPPLYLSPVPQRHSSPDMGIVPMSIDPPIHPPSPQPAHTHGEWTSFLYSMLEGDGVGVGVGVGSVGGAAHAAEPTWYELGLASIPPSVVSELPSPHVHVRTTTSGIEQPVDEGSNSTSTSTLRFALG